MNLTNQNHKNTEIFWNNLVNFDSLSNILKGAKHKCVWRLGFCSYCWQLKQIYLLLAAALQNPAEQQSRCAPPWAPAAPPSAPPWPPAATTLSPPPTTLLSTGLAVLVCLWEQRQHLVNIQFFCWPNSDSLVRQKLLCLWQMLGRTSSMARNGSPRMSLFGDAWC